jgi:2-polyprenyl-3-methyl-5-hydroxy-6-metoxy-1,4-benzoquinol methylase
LIETGGSRVPPIPDLAERTVLPERMDDPGLDGGLHREALRSLGRINQLSFTVSSLWAAIRPLAREAGGAPLRVLDVGCGGGEVLIGLARRAWVDGIAMEPAGCDLSERAVAFARQQASATGVPVEFFPLDLRESDLPEGYDVILSNLLLHHLRHEEAVSLMRRSSAAARRMVLVNDLLRSRAAYAFTWLGTRLVTRSHVVHEDGPLSVRAGWTPDELAAIAMEAGLPEREFTVERRFPWRLQLAWRRPVS